MTMKPTPKSLPLTATRLTKPGRVVARFRKVKQAPSFSSPDAVSHISGTPPRHGSRYTEFGRVEKMSIPEEMSGSRGAFLTLGDANTTREWVNERKARGRTIGLVPTMGALHEGHLDLVRRAAQECKDVIVSIYVNPTQFGAGEDLSSYPRSFRKDLGKLDALNSELEASSDKPVGRVRAIFSPHNEVMYPYGPGSDSRLVIDPVLTGRLEGASRPTFFQGVTTVVLKLLNIVQPDFVYFGQKDIQQLVVVRRMIDEFHIPTLLRAVTTTREADGVAMSSRNVYLGARRRKAATTLRRVLNAGVFGINQQEDGEPQTTERRRFLDAALKRAMELQKVQQALPPSQRVRFELDYLSFAHPQTLEEVEDSDDEGAIASGAIILLPLEEPQEGEILGLGRDENSVRLIDNIVIGKAQRLLGLTALSFRRWGVNERERPQPESEAS